MDGSPCRDVKQGKDEGGKTVLEKRRETNASLQLGKVGLADEAGADAMPDAAGGEGGHGAAKPEGVIHRNIRNQTWKDFPRQ